ncbi:eIF4-gamma/eIF5/eIF2-epsilon [Popillia japonica]|uniref:Translation initiation factor eIF2B subunit epsilon n=1 Tax=Popillia japonica TaxID=7064 RepID=A0AAW1LWS6_POPJA
MSKKDSDIGQKSDIIQAVIIADSFGNEFLPLSNDVPLMLLHLVNKPLIEYTLEFLSFGGVEEVFLFCCSHVDAIKEYIKNSQNENVIWSQTTKVNIIISESCRSFGDCLRDLDAKGLLRGNFVLCEPGVVSNIKLLPIIKKHIESSAKDKGTAMTLIYQEAGVGQYGRCPREEIVLASNSDNRVLFHKKINYNNERKINFPLEVFLENNCVSIQHNLKDTHIAICSPSVLPLFSDNFDFQTRDDFIKGLLMNEEILGSTVYWHLIKGNQHGGAITNWRMYQALSQELANHWFYPIIPDVKKYSECFGRGAAVGHNCSISESSNISKSIIGNNVTIGRNVTLENAYIMSDVKICNDCIVSNSIVGPKSILRNGCKVTFGSVVGANVELNKESFIENSLVQSKRPEDDYDDVDKLGERAYRLKLVDDDEEEDIVGNKLARRFSRLHLDEDYAKSDDDSLESSDSEDGLSHVHSPVPDDTNMFFSEVIDSLTRGFEDKLQCDNLILEINSSRYAYNVTLKEVNYNVIKAILNLPFQHSSGQQYLPALLRTLEYFSPILKNYIRNNDAMEDCLQAIEDVAASNNELCECIAKVLNWFYDRDHITEEAILLWYDKLDKISRVNARVVPFIKWLQEAEEASSSEESE